MTRPSSLPMLAVCSAFEGGSSTFADSGTNRHKALVKAYRGEAFEVEEGEEDAISWAVDYIKLKAPLSDYPIAFEERSSFIDSAFDEYSGTYDAACGPELFDLKWRRRDYTAQMAAYALMRIQNGGYSEVRAHVLFGECKQYEVLRFNEASALAIVEPIIERAKNPKPTVCDYCGWCARRMVCSAFNAPAIAAVESREDWKLETWHPSEISDPAQMAKALRAVPFLRKLADSISFHAREMWTKNGIQIPDCKLSERVGKRQCSDVNGAFNALGLEAEQFLACTSVQFTQLEKAYAKAKGIPVAAAKREIKTKLEPFVTRTASSVSVVPIKQEIIEEGETE